MVSYHDTSIDFSEVFHPLDQSRINLHPSLDHSCLDTQITLGYFQRLTNDRLAQSPQSSHRDQPAKTPRTILHLLLNDTLDAGWVFDQTGIDPLTVKMFFGINRQCVLEMVALVTDWMLTGSMWCWFTLDVGEVVTWAWWLRFDPMGKVSVWLKQKKWAKQSLGNLKNLTPAGDA